MAIGADMRVRFSGILDYNALDDFDVFGDSIPFEIILLLEPRLGACL